MLEVGTINGVLAHTLVSGYVIIMSWSSAPGRILEAVVLGMITVSMEDMLGCLMCLWWFVFGGV